MLKVDNLNISIPGFGIARLRHVWKPPQKRSENLGHVMFLEKHLDLGADSDYKSSPKSWNVCSHKNLFSQKKNFFSTNLKIE